MLQSQAPAGFITIGPGIYISVAFPGGAPPSPNDSAPNVILIFGWMGALTRHLQSYSRKYTELYPRATQIIVECAPSFFWTSERTQRNQLLPVAEALVALGCFPSVNGSAEESIRFYPRVLVHSFSNGGALQATSLSRFLASKYPSVPLSERFVSAFILDSSPSIDSLRSVGLAFSIAIRNPLVRYIALPLIYLVCLYHLCCRVVFGMETTRARALEALLQPRLLPWMDLQTPRLYVFSKKDELVPWQAVQHHADAAKASGLDVRCDVYEESAHVAHMRHDPKRYWASVQDLWGVACREDEARDTKAV